MKAYFVRLMILLNAVSSLWFIQMANYNLFDNRLYVFGLHPGRWEYWHHMFTSPLLHGSLDHLVSNSQALIMLGALILLKGWSDLAWATMLALLGSSLSVMILGEPGSNHIGASGIVFGWWAFLIMRAWNELNFRTAILSTLVILLYGGAVYGLFPGREGMSWEGHLGGALGGLLAARIKPISRKSGQSQQHYPTGEEVAKLYKHS